MTNPLVKLFQSVADVVNSYTKDRAVNVGEIYMHIQEQLDADAPKDDSGMITQSNGYVLDVYVDSESIFAVITRDGKLFKVPVTVSAENEITTGEYQEVVMEYTPVTGRQLQIRRSVDGKVRWFALPACTAVLNRSGEIDSRALFDSFVDHVERTGEYPELDFFHLGEHLVLGKADFVARDGVSYCASGMFYDTPIARAAIKSLEENKDYWGLSIAYLPTKEPSIIRTQEGIEIPVFNDGINRFISLLPESTAASILTNISTKEEEVTRMNEKVKDALKKLTGDDIALFDQLALRLDTVNREAAGMINRETPSASAPVAAAPAPATPVQIRAISEEDTNALLASDAFRARVAEIVAELNDRSVTTVTEQPPAPAAVEAPAPAATERENTVEQLLAALTVKVDSLAVSREAQITEVLNDLPSKVTRQQIYRPRATIMPDKLSARGQKVSMAEIASATLEKMGTEN